jgi:hypothetical protein
MFARPQENVPEWDARLPDNHPQYASIPQDIEQGRRTLTTYARVTRTTESGLRHSALRMEAALGAEPPPRHDSSRGRASFPKHRSTTARGRQRYRLRNGLV